MYHLVWCYFADQFDELRDSESPRLFLEHAPAPTPVRSYQLQAHLKGASARDLAKGFEQHIKALGIHVEAADEDDFDSCSRTTRISAMMGRPGGTK
jgi:hypothetical protein